MKLIKLVMLATVLVALPWTASVQAVGSAPGSPAPSAVYEVTVDPDDHTWGGEADEGLKSSQDKKTSFDGVRYVLENVFFLVRCRCQHLCGLDDRSRLLPLRR
jgi:hypothetical protein